MAVSTDAGPATAATEVARPTTGVCAAQGFLAGVAHAGLKADPTRPDVAVIYSERPAAAAAVFTTNQVKAAPVVISQLKLANGHARAVVVNAGNANACTGSQGFKDALAMSSRCADELDLDPAEVLVASTGVIGRLLPMDILATGIVAASHDLSAAAGSRAAEAIMTTDTRVKETVARFTHHGRTITVGGMAKGSGMIHINMATMLGFITTDAEVAPSDLATALRSAVEDTLNMVTIDGDTSTNDMVVLFANGAAGTPALAAGDGLEDFQAALQAVCRDLGRMIAADGEGATRMFTVTVTGAADVPEARILARTVASSNLVKAAIHGGDPNWGRIVAALGRAGCSLVLDRLTVVIGGQVVFHGGAGASVVDLEKVRVAFSQDEVAIECDLGLGDGTATAYGCDLTSEYVRINADYTT